MATKQNVIDALLAHPEWSSSKIAEYLGCDSEYVRATLRRNGLKFMRQPGEHGKAADERVARLARWRADIKANP